MLYNTNPTVLGSLEQLKFDLYFHMERKQKNFREKIQMATTKVFIVNYQKAHICVTSLMKGPLMIPGKFLAPPETRFLIL